MTCITTTAASVLYVDLRGERDSMLQVTVEAVPEVAMNVAIANIDFFEFADAVGADVVFRGFS